MEARVLPVARGEGGVGQPVVVELGRGHLLARDEPRIVGALERLRVDRLRVEIVGEAVAAIDAAVGKEPHVAGGDDHLRVAVVDDMVGEEHVGAVPHDHVVVGRRDCADERVLAVSADADRVQVRIAHRRRGGDFLRRWRTGRRRGRDGRRLGVGGGRARITAVGRRRGGQGFLRRQRCDCGNYAKADKKRAKPGIPQ